MSYPGYASIFNKFFVGCSGPKSNCNSVPVEPGLSQVNNFYFYLVLQICLKFELFISNVRDSWMTGTLTVG